MQARKHGTANDYVAARGQKKPSCAQIAVHCAGGMNVPQRKSRFHKPSQVKTLWELHAGSIGLINPLCSVPTIHVVCDDAK
jgi:hypothetical protein